MLVGVFFCIFSVERTRTSSTPRRPARGANREGKAAPGGLSTSITPLELLSGERGGHGGASEGPSGSNEPGWGAQDALACGAAPAGGGPYIGKGGSGAGRRRL